MKPGSYPLFLVLALIMVEAEITNLEHWMKDLPAQLKDVPLIYLAIPGSHDSMTYGITRSSGIAPDAEPILENLYPLFRGTIMRWTITQSLNVIQQLNFGIRYFDLRLATKKGANGFFFTHGLYADEISQPLREIKEFLDSHPEEVVILDFQHFYGFSYDDHEQLIKFLIDLYGIYLVPRHLDLERVTLNSLNRLRQQVIIVYRDSVVYATGEFWQPQTMPTPWPREEQTTPLLNFLRNIRRRPGMGFVHQAVLTPTSTFIVFRWTSSLRDKCAVPVRRDVLPKLMGFSPGRPRTPNDGLSPVNVVIADFVEMDNAIFPKTVIELNWKLLRNPDLLYQS